MYLAANCCDTCEPVPPGAARWSLRGLGFAGGGAGTAEMSESECNGRIAAGTATSFSVNPGAQGLPSQRRGTCYLKAPSTGGGFKSAAPSTATAQAASTVRSSQVFTPTIQVSPVISPQFVQQFQPSGSPVGLTSQAAPAQSGPQQGLTAADLQKILAEQRAAADEERRARAAEDAARYARERESQNAALAQARAAEEERAARLIEQLRPAQAPSEPPPVHRELPQPAAPVIDPSAGRAEYAARSEQLTAGPVVGGAPADNKGMLIIAALALAGVAFMFAKKRR